MVNHTQSLPDRNEDGTLAWYAAPTLCQNLFFRREMDYLKVKSNTTIYDRTMITRGRRPDDLMNEALVPCNS
ncbi:MAG: hypothetical protein LBU48_06060 [Coriobacteriales bacterium]|jgi:hypothetical protein|nr:hypothetical protein [Coriobacteriales bacterium]